MEQEDNIYIVGDIKHTEKARVLFENGDSKSAIDFILQLQQLMEEFGVVKVDVSIDGFKYANMSFSS